MNAIKSILIVGVLLATAGCLWQTVGEEELLLAIEMCADHDGVKSISSYGSGDYAFKCKDNTNIQQYMITEYKDTKLLWMLRSKG